MKKEALFNTVRPEYSQLDATTFSFIEKVVPNYKKLDNETVEVLNGSEYLERIEILWEDSAEEILQC